MSKYTGTELFLHSIYSELVQWLTLHVTCGGKPRASFRDLGGRNSPSRVPSPGNSLSHPLYQNRRKRAATQLSLRSTIILRALDLQAHANT